MCRAIVFEALLNVTQAGSMMQREAGHMVQSLNQGVSFWAHFCQ